MPSAAAGVIPLFWNNWLIVAFIAPMLWALVNLIDIYFINGIYENEYDGTIISGIFQITPWILVPWLGFNFPDKDLAVMAIAGGFLYSVSTFFYFKALFVTRDAAATELLWNLSIPIVPFIAFIFIGENLSAMHYAGIGISFIGASLLSFDDKIRIKKFRGLPLIMIGAVSFLAMSMIIEESVYRETDFWSAFLLFSLGAFTGGVFFWAFRMITGYGTGKKSLFKLSKQYFWIFLFAETLAVCGVVFLQRALAVSPSASFVTIIGAFQPAFIMVFSILIVQANAALRKKSDDQLIHRIYTEQLTGARTKLFALGIMTIGVWLVSR